MAKVAGEIKFRFSPAHDEGARQLIVGLARSPPPTSELPSLDHTADGNARAGAEGGNLGGACRVAPTSARGLDDAVGELEPEIAQGALPAEVERDRAALDAARPVLEGLLAPRLEGHLLVLRESVDRLQDAHRLIGEQSDVTVVTETRWAAIWELSGRCLSLSRLLLDELALGYTAETAGTIRVLDEGVHLLHAVVSDAEGDLVRRWLAGETVMPREVRPIIADEQEQAAAALAEQGVDLDADVVQLGREIYGHLSQAAHNARPGFRESVSRPLRLFVYGPHPNLRQRAVYVDYASEAIEGVLINVGNALARFLGGDWYRATIPPIQEQLAAVRDALPIDEEARARLGF